MTNNNLASFLKITREKRDLSVRQLAEKASVSHTEIFRIERGDRKNPSIAMLNALASALNTPVSEFLRACGIEETQRPSTTMVPAGLSDVEDLSSDELAKVQEYIKFIKTQRS